ncbi:snRNA-activating protein complex subunit-like [Durio zibethinus]|uniref:snRNA-activating protein complex subunit-like n=1 Tax=Durio zibethinus TaxID=66656 RepID=A0A6P6BFL5_DURZI|nr:snRNA-activating protein complex subunit-like [Durio zibethinus]
MGKDHYCNFKSRVIHLISLFFLRIMNFYLGHEVDSTRGCTKNGAAYPIIIFQLKPRAEKCNRCKINRGTKVTADEKWARESPCYFCDYCYSLLHSNDDECHLYGEFSVYHYVHD